MGKKKECCAEMSDARIEEYRSWSGGGWHVTAFRPKNRLYARADGSIDEAESFAAHLLLAARWARGES